MKTTRILILFCLALFARAQVASAQDMNARDFGRDGGAAMSALQNLNNNPYSQQEFDENGNPIPQEEQADSARVKEIMPLESYFFNDSIRVRKHFRWVADTYTNHVKMEQVDTLLGDFQRDYVFQKEDVGDANMGILGGATTPLNFFRRPRGNNFDYTKAYYAYLFTTENASHYNNKRPYTSLAYQTAGQKRYAEDKLEVLHAQNITPSTGFNIRYNNYHSRGMYTWQRGKLQDFSAALYHTGKRYSAHAGVITNSISQRENGGLVEAWHVTDTLYESAQGLPMKMSDALNKADNISLYAVQSYGIPFVEMPDSVFTMADRTAIHFGHAITFNRWGRRYSDTRKGTSYNITDRNGAVVEKKNFYDNWFIDPTQTSDTLTESLLSNRIFVQFVPYDRDGVVGTVDGGIGWDHHTYSQFRMKDYLGGQQRDKFNSYYAYADATGHLGKWFDWHGRARVNFAGYRAGDIDFDADAALRFFIKEQPLTLSASLQYNLQSPSYWQQHYFSNHFAWENNFQRENITQLDVSLDVPLTGTKVGFNQAILSNPIYYGYDSTPTQSMSVESVTGLYLEQNFVFGGLHLDHRLLLQYSSSEEIFPVPRLAGHISYYYAFEAVKDVLSMKVGVDCWANSAYYAQSYNPALMTFHNQNEVKVGNYPYANVFLAAKWKTMRIFVQYQHVSEGLLDNYKDSFSVPFYPYTRALLKYGVCWYFDD